MSRISAPLSGLVPGLPVEWASAGSGVPKYIQLRDALIACIQGGHFQPGAKLPTEQELARTTPFSLGTVQRALNELVNHGLVVRQQGNGTFVETSRKSMDAPWHCRFIADDGVSFLPVYPKVVARERIAQRGSWSAHLGQHGNNVMRIDRILGIADEFDVFSNFYLNIERFPGIAERPLDDFDGENLKLMFSREFGLPVTHVEQTMRFETFPANVREVLGRRHSSGMVLELAASAGRGRPVYYQELFIPRNSRRLVFSDTPVPARNPNAAPRNN